MITVIGKLADTRQYADAPGYGVFLQDNYDHAKNIQWLRDAIARGDWIQTVSDDVSGVYSEEYEMLKNAMRGKR